MGLIPDTPSDRDTTTQPQTNTAPIVHCSTDNANPAPAPEVSKNVVTAAAAFSFPNISVPHEVRPTTDDQAQFSVTVTLQNTPRFLGQYGSKTQAHFAIRLAIVLDQILRPVQRGQRDILLESDQVASIAALEHDYDFNGRTKDEIKEEVALHFLDIDQTIIWTNSPLLESHIQCALAALTEETRRAGFPARSTIPCLGH